MRGPTRQPPESHGYTRLGERGISLVEVLLGIALTAFVLGLAATLLRSPSRFVREVTEGLENSTLADLQGKELGDRFSRTYPMRRGFFKCGNVALARLLENTAPFPTSSVSGDVELSSAFSLAYANFSSLGSVITGNTMTVTDPRKFQKGTLVLLTLIRAPTVGGVFQVTDVDDAQLTVELSSGAVSVPAEFGCAIQNSVGLNALRNDPRNLVGGKSTQTFRMEAIRLVRYNPVEDPTNHRLRLIERVWPVAGVDGLIREAVSVDGFKSLKITESSWEPDSGGTGTNGTFFAVATVNRAEALAGGNGRGIASRPQSRRIGYNTMAGGVVNTGFDEAPKATNLTFPSCGIVTSPMQGLVGRDDDKFATMYRVTAKVVGTAPIRIEITFGSGGATQPTCWQTDQIVVGANSALQVPAAMGLTGSASIGPSSSGLSALVCDSPPSSTFQGVLQYFDTVNNSIVNCPCSSTTIAAGTLSFDYQGPASSCTKTGDINLGKLVVHDSTPPQQGPVLFLGGDGCQWANPPATATAGFSDCTPDPLRGDLLKIRMRPLDIPGGIPGATGAGNNEIDCT